MPKWSAKKEGKLLCSLFDEGVADPSFTKASDIDEIKNLKRAFDLWENDVDIFSYR